MFFFHLVVVKKNFFFFLSASQTSPHEKEGTRVTLKRRKVGEGTHGRTASPRGRGPECQGRMQPLSRRPRERIWRVIPRLSFLSSGPKGKKEKNYKGTLKKADLAGTGALLGPSCYRTGLGWAAAGREGCAFSIQTWSQGVAGVQGWGQERATPRWCLRSLGGSWAAGFAVACGSGEPRPGALLPVNAPTGPWWPLGGEGVGAHVYVLYFKR